VESPVPIVVAVQGSAVGGGFGLSLIGDFRVASARTRFACNFAKLGFHHGFGITETLPRVGGSQRALEILYTATDIYGEEAKALGLIDRLAEDDDVRDCARRFAENIATSAPLAVEAIRLTMLGDLPDRVRAATRLEAGEQRRLRGTRDFREGVNAMAEGRQPRFIGR
jgi:enoyl-CoA hydratase/carnithine racemase